MRNGTPINLNWSVSFGTEPGGILINNIRSAIIGIPLNVIFLCVGDFVHSFASPLYACVCSWLAGRWVSLDPEGRSGDGFPWASAGSKASLDKRVAEKPLSGGTPFLLHKDLSQKVSACVRNSLGQVWLCRLSGDLENGCHCFIFSPRGLLG